MSTMSYNTGDLRTGAAYDRHGSDAADTAGRDLAGVTVAAGIFGDVAGGGPLSGALGSARDQHVRTARTAATSMTDQAGNTSHTADLGDHLTAETRTAANQGVVRRIADGM